MDERKSEFIKKLVERWSFYWQNFRLSVVFCVIAMLFIVGATLCSKWCSNHLVCEALMSTGIAIGIVGLFDVIYEVRTRDSFREILAQINPNVQSGVIVHPSHERIVSREKAIEEFLFPGATMRIITSTADNYVRNGEPAYDVLLEKIRKEQCRLKVLLYMPVYEERQDWKVGQRCQAPQELINEHQTLMLYYERMVQSYSSLVSFKFFTLPIHTNFMMIGDERMFGAPILHTVFGRSLPCYEIYPTGSRSIFYMFQKDFDEVFKCCDRSVVVSLAEGKRLYERAGYKLDALKCVWPPKSSSKF